MTGAASTQNRLGDFERDLRAKQSEHSRLNRICQSLPTLGLWKTALKQLDALTEIRLLADDFAARRVAAIANLQSARQKLHEANEQQEQRLREMLDEITVDQLLLSEADTIEELRERLGSHRKAAADRPGLAMEQQAAENAAKETLRNLGRPAELNDVELQRLPRDKIFASAESGERAGGTCRGP